MLKALIKTIDFVKNLRHRRLFNKISIATLISVCVAYLVVWIVFLTPQIVVAAQAWHYLVADYVNTDEVNPSELYNRALDGLQSSLVSRDESISQAMIDSMLELVTDDHTEYLSPEIYQRLMHSLDGGTFTGIGVWIQTSDEGIFIIPMPDSPAEQAGILAGDRILEIDGQSTEGMSISTATSLIGGDPQTEVVLRIQRDGVSDPFPIPITRDNIVEPSVRAEEIPGDIVYIRLYRFSDKAADEFVEELGNLVNDDTAGIIIDVRDNGGGRVDICIKIASLFLNEGDAVTKYVDGNLEVTNVFAAVSSELSIDPDMPIAILQNDEDLEKRTTGSASASEMFAGALQDLRDNTSIIGTNSYGKGSAQRIVNLFDGSALKVTFTYWTTPNGTWVNGDGLTPDIWVEGNDAQLEAAIDYVKNS